ncbi:MAG TPA: hypothetical protein DIS94_08075 [Bacteroidetes bacterium]|nr:hypothetical protein [Bacteroidota bacterium]
MYINKDIECLIKLSSAKAAKKFKLIDKIIKDSKKIDIDYVKLYECILQVYLFCGFPATIESLKVFKKYYPVNSVLLEQKVINPREKGLKTFKKIYGNNYKKVILNIQNLSDELSEWMLLEGYGKVLSRQGLTLAEREIINVSVLCTDYYPVQLFSHIKGCLNCGLTKKEIAKVIELTGGINTEGNIKKSLKILKTV